MDEQVSVRFGDQAFVEHDNDAVVGAASDEASEALFESDNCFGELIITEGITAAFADAFESGLDERAIGHGERQLGDDDVSQGLALHIDTLPE